MRIVRSVPYLCDISLLALAVLVTSQNHSIAQMRTQPEKVLQAIPAATPAAAQPAGQDAHADILQHYGKLPISFEPNRGQADAHVQFAAHGNGYGVYLSSQAALLVLQKPALPFRGPQTRDNLSFARHRVRPPKADVLRMQLLRSNPNAQSAGIDQLPGVANYYIGNDASKWHTDIPTYSKVRFAEVYRGIDLIYYGNQRQLEYDFVVAPFANPAKIQLGFSGADRLSLAQDGGLRVQTKDSQVIFHKPVVYQDIDGEHREVEGRFTLLSYNTVGFSLGAYDHARPLVIDPVLIYSTYLGGDYDDQIIAIGVDNAGNAYLTGYTRGNFPVRKSSVKFSPLTGFVAALNASGSALLYATYLGGSYAYDTPSSIAVSPSGYAYVAGSASSSDFPVTKGAFQTVHKAPWGTPNGYVSKLYPAGGMAYSTYLGGSGQSCSGSGDGCTIGDWASAIALDSAGNAYVTGSVASADFPTTPGAFQLTHPSNAQCAFVSKLNTNGTALLYSSFLGGSSFDTGNAITTDSTGAAYVAGDAQSADFPTTSNAFQPIKPGHGASGFVSKINASGTSLLYSTYLGGSSGSSIHGIAVNSLGNAYVAGITSDTDFPVTGNALQTTYHGEGDGFIAQLNPSGTQLMYATYLGGTYIDSINSIALDPAGNAVVAGDSGSTDFPLTPGALQNELRSRDAFVARLNPEGTELLYSTFLGGGWNDSAQSIALDPSGSAYVAGYTDSGDFPVTTGAFDTARPGIGSSGFVTKLDLNSKSLRTATTTILDTSANHLTSSDPVTYVATVSSGDSNSSPSGFVAFSVDGNFKASVPLTEAGTATYSTKFFESFTWTHQVQASYVGSQLLAPSVASVMQNVDPVAVPVFSLPSGKYTGGISVALSDASPHAILHYTLDGSTPGASSPIYAGPISIPSGYITISAVAIENGSAMSWLAQATYSIVAQAPAPLISPAPGAYPVGQLITITDANAAATIRYTTDGSTPTSTSNWYHGPIALAGSAVIKALAITSGEAASNVSSAIYTVP